MGSGSSLVRVAFLGDIHLGSCEFELGSQLEALLRDCDCVIANIESPICEESPVSERKILLRTLPGLDRVLAAWNVTHATVANNHMFDHGEEGFKATRAALDARGITCFGAGEDLVQASQPVFLTVNGIRIAIVACADAITQAQLAGEGKAGCNPLAFPLIEEQIQALRRNVDFAVVCPHWGYCDFRYPSLDVVIQGEALLAAGADLVVGHHSHSVQGIVRREGGSVIAYSLGDFCFDVYRFGKRRIRPSRENRRGMILVVEFGEDRTMQVRQVYTRHVHSRVNVDPSRRRVTAMARRSEPLQNVADYPRFWRSVVRRRFLKRLLYWLNPLLWTRVKAATLSSAVVMLKQLLDCRGDRCGDFSTGKEQDIDKGIN